MDASEEPTTNADSLQDHRHIPSGTFNILLSGAVVAFAIWVGLSAITTFGLISIPIESLVLWVRLIWVTQFATFLLILAALGERL